MSNKKHLPPFERLLDILDELREKCPWDREQTMDSLRTLSIEETYELSDAVIRGDFNDIKKELGDLFLHVVFYAKIAGEQDKFDMSDVINALCDKLIYRHPHVFGEVKADRVGDVVRNWEQLKIKEKDGNKTVLSGVPVSLPALVKAGRIQEKAAAAGFDWEQKEQVWDKLEEEKQELMHEINNMDKDKTEAEFGDLFFSLINAARLYGINPDTALERTNRKFINRFTYLENKTIRQGRSLKSMTLDEMNEIWEEAKRFSEDGSTSSNEMI
ncbi:MAG: nucleoside triphosphate pyrophosphohydrolase [Prevotellaceae bacterium]|jgi:XTP/dITP diphosphohydrolase|nr:nucleoside triphosphate pyrophosphohydrolase [Prevotellaceae bacterium]